MIKTIPYIVGELKAREMFEWCGDIFVFIKTSVYYDKVTAHVRRVAFGYENRIETENFVRIDLIPGKQIVNKLYMEK